MNVERVCKGEVARAREGFERRWTSATAFTSFGSLTAFTGGGGGAGAKSLNHCVEDSFQKTEFMDAPIFIVESGGMCSIYSSQLVSVLILTK